MDFDEKRFRENQFPASDYFPLCKAAGFNLFGLGRGQYMFADAVESYLAKQMKERDMQAGLFPKSDNPQPKSGESMLRFEASDFFCTNNKYIDLPLAKEICQIANAKFSEWLERQPVVYGFGSSFSNSWSKFKADEDTHTARLIAITPIEQKTEAIDNRLREIEKEMQENNKKMRELTDKQFELIHRMLK